MAFSAGTFKGSIETLIQGFPNFYETSWPLVDALVFLLIFVGLARVVFEKRFPGQGGKAMIMGVGLALSLGMVFAEVQYGFSLKTFGPMAAGIVLMLMCFMLFHVGKAFGFSTGGSIALVFFLGVPLAPQLMPDLAQLIGQVLPLVILFWLASGAVTGHSVWDKAHGLQNKTNIDLTAPMREENKKIDNLDHEEKRGVRDARRQSHRVIKFLMRIRSDLQRRSISQSSVEDIQSKLRSLLKADHELMLDLDRLARTVQQLGRIDQETLRKTQVQLRGLGNVEASGKPQLVQRLSYEDAMQSLRNEVKKYNDAFLRAIQQVIYAIQTKRQPDALKWIDHAIVWERRAGKLLEDVQHGFIAPGGGLHSATFLFELLDLTEKLVSGIINSLIAPQVPMIQFPDPGFRIAHFLIDGGEMLRLHLFPFLDLTDNQVHCSLILTDFLLQHDIRTKDSLQS